MEYIYAIILGIVQGLTEFLPVSSSGHLVLASEYLKFEQPGVLFEAILHIGTTLAVIWYLRDRILKISFQEIKLIVVATIPAALAGVLLREQLEALFSLIKLVGITFLISAYMNFKVDKYNGKKEHIDFWDALIIGVFQAIAIIPAISRSGATIYAGTRMNLDKKKAAEFSFLISIPAIIGANVVEFISHGGNGDFSPLLGLVGLIAAFISGIIAIHFLLSMLMQNKFKVFGYYLIVVGVITLLFL
ncbi:hypothetical protein A2803_04910 [Candidatus Woesebacteria bacterium RIFCSPHIGHO2_01_FULL_44_21]|uniref:Undecaprenyl-diphosphatase n=1 Tax=Candidatus Woesebacteria bacterium RIFCSPHIGHO2_01_FULL_44_21 TaxID=1802503 RepID=A0A1F7Z1H0_9BACT|nr:MAG: hypothetical protein A2803_04910 [Candidatus Woesebacteria bacterium RIFCSPHIGHO2_01_FULL_44_21]OGM69457.1 MAG: hypothetical protein A2897_03840 [Candidatus Woesebacteria bacterium RIFCSPLOWO2_01_FULL_44_24b]